MLSGTLRDSPTKVKKDFNSTDIRIPRVTDLYKARGNLRSLTNSKLEHLKKMYGNFIAEENGLTLSRLPQCKNVYGVLYVYVYISPKIYDIDLNFCQQTFTSVSIVYIPKC